jgi:hypothetical protein
MGSIHEKNTGKKSRATVPLKGYGTLNIFISKTAPASRHQCFKGTDQRAFNSVFWHLGIRIDDFLRTVKEKP